MLLCVTFAIHHERGRCFLRGLDTKELLTYKLEFSHAIENIFIKFWTGSGAHTDDSIIQNSALFDPSRWHDGLWNRAVWYRPFIIDRIYRTLILDFSLFTPVVSLVVPFHGFVFVWLYFISHAWGRRTLGDACASLPPTNFRIDINFLLVKFIPNTLLIEEFFSYSFRGCLWCGRLFDTSFVES